MLGQICNQMIWPGNVTECNEFKKVYNPGCIIRRRVLTDDPTKKYHPTYERYLDAKDYVEFGKVMLPMHTPVHNEIGKSYSRFLLKEPKIRLRNSDAS